MSRCDESSPSSVIDALAEADTPKSKVYLDKR